MLTKKQTKEFGYRKKAYIKKNRDYLKMISPLGSFFKNEWEWIDVDKEFFCNNDRFKSNVIAYKGKKYYQKDFEEIISGIIIADEEIKKGNIEYLELRSREIGEFGPLIGCINNKRKIEFIKKFIKWGGVCDNTLFLLKMTIYGTLEVYDDAGTELTKLCIEDNETDAIDAAATDEDIVFEKLLMDEERNDFQIMKYELELIKESMRNDKPIKLYRGFSIDSSQRVRQGYKEDGESYFKQDAGAGISYSLSRYVAGYFAMRSIMMKDGQFIRGNNFYSGHITKQMKTPQLSNLVSREHFIKERAKDISSARDERELKPIICEYLLEPKQLKGYFLGLGEGEVMTLPDEVKVTHYEIPTSKEIAKCEYEWINRNVAALTEIAGGLMEEGLVCWISVLEYGKAYAIFAKAEDVKEDADEFLSTFFGGTPKEIQEAAYNFNRSMEQYAVALPNDLIPTDFTLKRKLWKFLRKPVDLVMDAGRKYRVGTIKNK